MLEFWTEVVTMPYRNPIKCPVCGNKAFISAETLDIGVTTSIPCLMPWIIKQSDKLSLTVMCSRCDTEIHIKGDPYRLEKWIQNQSVEVPK